MKTNYHKMLVELLDNEIESVERVRNNAEEDKDEVLLEGADLRLELLGETKKEVVENIPSNSIYFSVTDAIEQEIDRYDKNHENYLKLKFEVEFDRKNLKIDEQAELAKAKEDGLKLTNDDMRKAHLNKVMENDYKALFNKRGEREACYHKSEVAKFYMKYYMAIYENRGNVEVEDRLFEEKQETEGGDE